MNRITRYALTIAFGAGVCVAGAYPAYDDYSTHVDTGWAPTDFLLSYRKPYNSPVEPGYWHSTLEDCKNYCLAHGVPLVAVWSNGESCGHCKKLESNANSIAFREWAKTSGIVFYFGYAGDAYPENTLGPSCIWASGGNTSKTLPFVRIWWPQGGVDVSIDGDTWDGFYARWGGGNDRYEPENFLYPGDYDTYNQGGRYMANYLMNPSTGVLASRGYKPVPSYAGGDFMVSDDPQTSLQVVVGQTPRLMIPLWRTNEVSVSREYLNWVWGVYPDGSTFTNSVNWAADGKMYMSPIDVTVNNRVKVGDVGKTIRVCLLDSEKKIVAERKVYCVSAQEHPNSVENPYWIGERNADTLGWGEWTMDLDAVTNKVANWKRNNPDYGAFAMVLVGGGLWCPDCAMAEKYFYGTAEFTDWAKRNRVALGIIDIPNNPGTLSGYLETPSLLTYTTARASDAYVTCRGTCPADESKRMRSGAPYISRHGIQINPQTGIDVNGVAIRNNALMSKNVLNGGWNRPERPNQNRTGVPIVIALRADGKIIGRWNAFSDIGPSEWKDGYLLRLQELLLQSDEQEESNDDWRTTKQKIVKRAAVAATAKLSHTDLADTYQIETNAVGQSVSFQLTTTADVQGTLSIVQASPTLQKTLASASGIMSNGLVVAAYIPVTNCYLKVSIDTASSSKPGTPVSAAVAADNPDSTVFTYNIASDSVLEPVESATTETVTDGIPKVTIATEKGASYKITNLADSVVDDGLFVKGAGENIYIAQQDGATTLTLKDPDQGSTTSYTTTYQIWNTGRMGFEASGIAVSEPSDASYGYQIRIRRTGGSAGVAKASIYLDRTDSRTSWITWLEELGVKDTVFQWEDDYKELVWNEGETDVKTFTVFINPNEYADGDQQLVFKLVKGESDADLSVSEFVLTIKDDDEPSAGTIAILGTDPVCQKQMTLMAREGSTIDIAVGRQNGADGEVTASLEASAGEFAGGGTSTNFSWSTRSADIRHALLTLPMKSSASQVKVTVASFDGAKTDPDRKTLVVKLLSADTLKFESDTVTIDNVWRYAPITPAEVAVAEVPGVEWSEVSVVKYSGSLPAGLDFTYNQSTHKVVISGTPTVAGMYSATYQIRHDGEEGGTLKVGLTVVDPTVPSLSVPEPLNESVVVSRAFQDILVADSQGHLAGVMALSIPRSGRLSAKFRSIAGETVSYLSESWSKFDIDLSYVAELVAVTEGFEGQTFTVRAKRDGSVVVSDFENPLVVGDACECMVPDAQEFAVANWEGYYTVNISSTNELSAAERPFASGYAYALLKMNTEDAIASGRMTYAGVLPNGKAYSGSAALLPDSNSYDAGAGEYARALLPVISVSSADVFTGVFSIKPYAKAEHVNSRRSVYSHDAMRFLWRHFEVRDEISSEIEFEAFGGYYSNDESLQKCCEEGSLQANRLTFFVLGEQLRTQLGFDVASAPYAWQTEGADVGVLYGGGVNRLGLWYAPASLEAHGLTLAADLDTGLVSGRVNLEFPDRTVSATWRGVILPGWGSGCGACTLGNAEALLRPFIGGSCWFTDVYSYTDAKGRQRTLSVKRGCPISVGVNAGE